MTDEPLRQSDYDYLAARSVPRRVEEGGASAPPLYDHNYVTPETPAGLRVGDPAPDPTLEWVVDPSSHFAHMRGVFATEVEAQKHAEACPAHTRIYPRLRASVLTEPTSPTPPLTAADFCAEAARLVGGSRATTHGDKSLNFRNIAELWNGYWRLKCRQSGERLSTPFTAWDVGNMMELMKVARRFAGEFNADDYIDAAGYAGCTGEIAARDAHTTTD